MDMKGMNPYQHFGFRQPWLEHYMSDGTECFLKEFWEIGNMKL